MRFLLVLGCFLMVAGVDAANVGASGSQGLWHLATRSMATQRIHVFFSGRVQNVGFRQSVKDLADGLGLVGWVRNLDDGRVEMVAEGAEDDLRQLMRSLHEKFRIDEARTREERGGGKLVGFEILP